ncbi:hypothetical protein niasHT_029161 [Heterodera trifolii]|uniref:Uncharacterized protein n=1 Tax=Heterodera trifolii TaxID=157864 RepID=A0ABD2JYI3_9BILA
METEKQLRELAGLHIQGAIDRLTDTELADLCADLFQLISKNGQSKPNSLEQVPSWPSADDAETSWTEDEDEAVSALSQFGPTTSTAVPAQYIQSCFAKEDIDKFFKQRLPQMAEEVRDFLTDLLDEFGDGMETEKQLRELAGLHIQVGCHRPHDGHGVGTDLCADLFQLISKNGQSKPNSLEQVPSWPSADDAETSWTEDEDEAVSALSQFGPSTSTAVPAQYIQSCFAKEDIDKFFKQRLPQMAEEVRDFLTDLLDEFGDGMETEKQLRELAGLHIQVGCHRPHDGHGVGTDLCADLFQLISKNGQSKPNSLEQVPSWPSADDAETSWTEDEDEAVSALSQFGPSTSTAVPAQYIQSCFAKEDIDKFFKQRLPQMAEEVRDFLTDLLDEFGDGMETEKQLRELAGLHIQVGCHRPHDGHGVGTDLCADLFQLISKNGQSKPNSLEQVPSWPSADDAETSWTEDEDEAVSALSQFGPSTSTAVPAQYIQSCFAKEDIDKFFKQRLPQMAEEVRDFLTDLLDEFGDGMETEKQLRELAGLHIQVGCHRPHDGHGVGTDLCADLFQLISKNGQSKPNSLEQVPSWPSADDAETSWTEDEDEAVSALSQFGPSTSTAVPAQYIQSCFAKEDIDKFFKQRLPQMAEEVRDFLTDLLDEFGDGMETEKQLRELAGLHIQVGCHRPHDGHGVGTDLCADLFQLISKNGQSKPNSLEQVPSWPSADDAETSWTEDEDEAVSALSQFGPTTSTAVPAQYIQSCFAKEDIDKFFKQRLPQMAEEVRDFLTDLLDEFGDGMETEKQLRELAGLHIQVGCHRPHDGHGVGTDLCADLFQLISKNGQSKPNSLEQVPSWPSADDAETSWTEDEDEAVSALSQFGPSTSTAVPAQYIQSCFAKEDIDKFFKQRLPQMAEEVRDFLTDLLDEFGDGMETEKQLRELAGLHIQGAIDRMTGHGVGTDLCADLFQLISKNGQSKPNSLEQVPSWPSADDAETSWTEDEDEAVSALSQFGPTTSTAVPAQYIQSCFAKEDIDKFFKQRLPQMAEEVRDFLTDLLDEFGDGMETEKQLRELAGLHIQVGCHRPHDGHGVGTDLCADLFQLISKNGQSKPNSLEQVPSWPSADDAETSWTEDEDEAVSALSQFGPSTSTAVPAQYIQSCFAKEDIDKFFKQRLPQMAEEVRDFLTDLLDEFGDGMETEKQLRELAGLHIQVGCHRPHDGHGVGTDLCADLFQLISKNGQSKPNSLEQVPSWPSADDAETSWTEDEDEAVSALSQFGPSTSTAVPAQYIQSCFAKEDIDKFFKQRLPQMAEEVRDFLTDLLDEFGDGMETEKQLRELAGLHIQVGCHRPHDGHGVGTDLCADLFQLISKNGQSKPNSLEQVPSWPSADDAETSWTEDEDEAVSEDIDKFFKQRLPQMAEEVRDFLTDLLDEFGDDMETEKQLRELAGLHIQVGCHRPHDRHGVGTDLCADLFQLISKNGQSKPNSLEQVPSWPSADDAETSWTEDEDEAVSGNLVAVTGSSAPFHHRRYYQQPHHHQQQLHLSTSSASVGPSPVLLAARPLRITMSASAASPCVQLNMTTPRTIVVHKSHSSDAEGGEVTDPAKTTTIQPLAAGPKRFYVHSNAPPHQQHVAAVAGGQSPPFMLCPNLDRPPPPPCGRNISNRALRKRTLTNFSNSGCHKWQKKYARDMLQAENACARAQSSHLCAELPASSFCCMCPDNVTQFDDGSCGTVRIEELPPPKQCLCQNGGICTAAGTFMQMFLFSFSNRNGAYYALLLVFSMLMCLGMLTVIVLLMYKKKILLDKKRQAAGDGTSSLGASVVSFHGNVISFSNPVLDDRRLHQQSSSSGGSGELQQQQHDGPPSSELLHGLNMTTTTFANPVYDHGDTLSYEEDTNTTVGDGGSSSGTKFDTIETGKM